jgi:hypothetical protein
VLQAGQLRLLQGRVVHALSALEGASARVTIVPKKQPGGGCRHWAAGTPAAALRPYFLAALGVCSTVMATASV